MVQMIVGQKGKGKTKELLDKVNREILTASGNIVYLDKSAKHMYELNNKVRMIDVSLFPIHSTDAFLGFVSGILSQDHDLMQMYFDSFLKIASVDNSALVDTVNKLDELSKAFHVDFILSVSLDASEIPAAIEDKIIIAL
ncbi:MAG: twitching motility protein PilT [Lachnospiraceae bacterium]|nr:twitching motility protein PilT [Lachnospiraceae bacterium]